jgi:hypothetical protein
MGIVKVNPLAALAAESTESAVTSRTKDGLCGVVHEVGNSKTISHANVGHQDDSGATIGFGGAAHRDGNGADGDGVDSILLMVLEDMGKDQWL